MVLSHSDSATGKRAAHREVFSVGTENNIDILITVDNSKENSVSSTALIEQEMAVDAQLGCLSLVELTFQHQGGEMISYSIKSMSPEEQSRLLHTLAGKSLVSSRSSRYEARRISQARKSRQRSVRRDGSASMLAERRTRRHADSTDSSCRSSARSDLEDRSDDSIPVSKSKRVKKASMHSTKISRGSRPRTIRMSQMEDCTGQLRLADDAACSAFYRRVLIDAQQDLCKKLAKWWIKAINPNKQTNHPYAGGPDKKPDWWPLTPPNDATGVPSKGTLENGFVRHREPDHLSKSERLVLLPYVLIQIVDPRNRGQFNHINASKLEQISLDYINNETAVEERHESWRRFVREIFRVAKMQERYKSNEIDDTTFTSVRPSYDSWRHRAPSSDLVQGSMCDGIYEEADDQKRTLTPEVSHLRSIVPDGQALPDPFRKDTTQDYPGCTQDSRFLPQHSIEANDQRFFQLTDVQISMSNQLPYISSIQSMPKAEQQSNLLPQELFRKSSDSCDRFSSPSNCHSNLLPNSNLGSVTSFQYQSIPAPFHLAAVSNSQNGPVLPPPLSAAMTRHSTDMSNFSPFYDNGYCPRLNMPFPTPPREHSLSSHHNMHQLTQQPQSFQDYSQEYCDKGPKVHILNVINPVRPAFTFEQESDTKPEFGYDSKSRCSLDNDTIDLEEMANGSSNGHGGAEHKSSNFRPR